MPGEVGGDGFAASGEVFIGRDFDGGGVGRNIGVGDAQDGGLMRQVCLEVVAAVFDQGACPTVTEVSGFGGGVFRGVGQAESVTAFVVVVGNIGLRNTGCDIKPHCRHTPRQSAKLFCAAGDSDSRIQG
jgi:hypothetical protein